MKLLFVGFLLASQAMADPRPLSTSSNLPTGAAGPEYGDFGFALDGMDRAVKPGDDFWLYANGTWDRSTTIPADKSTYGNWAILRDLSLERTRAVIEDAARSGTGSDADAWRVGTFYATFMDRAAIEAKGMAAIQPALDRIAAIRTRSDLAQMLGDDARRGIAGPFATGVEQDPKNPSQHMVWVSQSGLGMPDRDYYIVDLPRFASTRAQYVKHVATIFRLAGFTDADERAKAVVALETGLARVQWTKVEDRDPVKTFNPHSPAQLAALAPGMDWRPFLAAAGIAGQNRLDIAEPSACAGMAKLVADVPLPVWRDYLAYHLLTAEADVLPKAIDAESFAFDGTVLAGQPEQEARWKRGVDAVDDAMGEAVGRLYVARYFPPKAAAEVKALVDNLLASMGDRIDKATWMSPQTKAEARKKLAAFDPKLGYPAHWRDYSDLVVVAGDAVGNADRARQFEYDRNLTKLGSPLDRTEWSMTPMTVDAAYNPALNDITFPAAIMQPPFFDPAADPAVNYGAIGAVIGHEISHGFDDQGRQYDGSGALRDWWTPADAKAFTLRADRLVKQYDGYEPLPGHHIQGALTLGENIADLSGLRIAYDAYHRSLGGKPAPVIDGLTGDQRFFLGYAQVWRGKTRDADRLAGLTSDPHSPGRYRVATVRNFDPWYAAFGVKPGDALYLKPEDRIRIW